MSERFFAALSKLDAAARNVAREARAQEREEIAELLELMADEEKDGDLPATVVLIAAAAVVRARD